jgi:ubiquinone/menaquinone biosynthesis C-methylase UbiE
MDTDHVRQRYAGKAAQEWDRLCSTPIMRIEYMITTHFLNRYLPESGIVLDAGSGPGRYALDLVRKGYRAVMLDLLHEMLLLGQEKVAEADLQDKVMAVEGNIASLPYTDNCFDAVINLGAPISHITDAQARIRAVHEFARVVKPDGLVFLTGMSRLACYRGSVFWLKQHPEFFEQLITAEYRASGIMDGSQVWYNFAPGELEGLAKYAGLHVVDRVGCEGLANHLPVDALEQIEGDERYGPAWKEILLDTANDPSIIGISNHLLVVARKP